MTCYTQLQVMAHRDLTACSAPQQNPTAVQGEEHLVCKRSDKLLSHGVQIQHSCQPAGRPPGCPQDAACCRHTTRGTTRMEATAQLSAHRGSCARQSICWREERSALDSSDEPIQDGLAGLHAGGARVRCPQRTYERRAGHLQLLLSSACQGACLSVRSLWVLASGMPWCCQGAWQPAGNEPQDHPCHPVRQSACAAPAGACMKSP